MDQERVQLLVVAFRRVQYIILCWHVLFQLQFIYIFYPCFLLFSQSSDLSQVFSFFLYKIIKCSTGAFPSIFKIVLQLQRDVCILYVYLKEQLYIPEFKYFKRHTDKSAIAYSMLEYMYNLYMSKILQLQKITQPLLYTDFVQRTLILIFNFKKWHFTGYYECTILGLSRVTLFDLLDHTSTHQQYTHP